MLFRSHPDGTLRRLYCQEAPEPWFEDFGQGQLVQGRATVRLDPDFAPLVRNDDYAVFPVPEGDCKGLYIASKSPTSFEVRELQGGTSSLPFRYRLVAKRRDLDQHGRLERVEVHQPSIPRGQGVPTLPTVPDAPAPNPRPGRER